MKATGELTMKTEQNVDRKHTESMEGAIRERAGHDVVLHEVVPDNNYYHRLTVNGFPGGWVAKVAIARNGVYCATTEYFEGVLPRIFIVVDLAADGTEDA